MMQAVLCVITCDKCGKVMKKGQNIVIVAVGVVARSDEDLDFEESGVHYACHRDCWDGVEIE